MGYVPYPAGIVGFRNGVVTELVGQKANIHGPEIAGPIDQPPALSAVGPSILEGSKRGATACACWLAHKTIPLDVRGHGQIVKASLLNAKRLHRYLEHHARHL